MNATTQRYAPGGDIYAIYSAKYGSAAANQIYAAAVKAEETGDKSLIGDALGRIKFGDPLEESATKILGSQLYNEPLTAPLEQLSTVTENTVASLFSFKNWGLYVIMAAVVAYFILARR